MIENTSNYPALHLLGAMHGDPSAAILAMEAQGQQQLLHSDRLPVETREPEAEYLALGFTFGAPDPADPLFRPATLPDGWTRRGSDHSMWSYLDDEQGRPRVAIFYKAAFYDRRASMNLVPAGAVA